MKTREEGMGGKMKGKDKNEGCMKEREGRMGSKH